LKFTSFANWVRPAFADSAGMLRLAFVGVSAMLIGTVTAAILR